MEKFFLGEDLERAKRMPRLLNKLTGKTVYIEEDFGSDRLDDPWRFFVRTLPPDESRQIILLLCKTATFTNTISGLRVLCRHNRKLLTFRLQSSTLLAKFNFYAILQPPTITVIYKNFYSGFMADKGWKAGA